MLLGIAFSLLAGDYASRRIEDEYRARFDRHADDAKHAIEQHLRANSEVLYELRGLLEGQEANNGEKSRRYVLKLDLQQRHPGTEAFTFTRYVIPSQKAEFEETVRRDTRLDPNGYPHFAINRCDEMQG